MFPGDERIDYAIERIYAQHLYAGFLDALVNTIKETVTKMGRHPKPNKERQNSLVNVLQTNFHMCGLGTTQEAEFVVASCFQQY